MHVWQDKMHMTVSADSVNCGQRIRLNRPPNCPNEEAMKDDLKIRGFSWKGYGESGCWFGDASCVEMWEDVTWRRRVKLNCSNISFFGPDGTNMDMLAYIDAVKDFDPTALDDDLSTLGASTVPANPTTPTAPSNKRARAHAPS